MNERLHLVYATDANYLFLTRVSLCSAAKMCARPDDLVFHVLDCGIPDADWDRFVSETHAAVGEVAIVRHPLDMAQFAGFPKWRGNSMAIYGRLDIPSILPDLEWCVYSDADTLFTDDPLKLLDLRDPDAAMLGQLGTQPYQHFGKWYDKHHISQDWDHYVCSGFLLINLVWFRAHDVTGRCLDLIRTYPDIPCVDETVLNLACAGHVKGLPHEWGIFSYLAFEVPRPACIHYLFGIALPTRMRFRWGGGYFDAAVIWLNFVKEVLGVSRTDLRPDIPWWRWLAVRTYCHLTKWLVCTALCLPRYRRSPRWRELRSRYATRATAHLLSSAFWRR